MTTEAKLIERVARVMEPTLWEVPYSVAGTVFPQFNANVKGLQLCARRKAKALIDAGLIVGSDKIGT